MQVNLAGVVDVTFGYDCSWTPAGGGLPIIGRILLKEPTEKDSINGIEYNPRIYIAEYFHGAFPSLYESSRTNTVETVVINGSDYEVRIVKLDYDGKTYKAILEKVVL